MILTVDSLKEKEYKRDLLPVEEVSSKNACISRERVDKLNNEGDQTRIKPLHHASHRAINSPIESTIAQTNKAIAPITQTAFSNNIILSQT